MADRSTRRAPASFAACAFALVAFLCVLALAFAPAARADGIDSTGTYEITKVNITADAQSDGSLHVVEQRTFVLHGDVDCIRWNMRSSSFTLDSVQVGVPDENGDVQLADATQAAFDFKWREKGGPGTQSYAVDTGRSDFYFYVYGQDEQVVMQMDYTIKAGVTAYKDCADLYWQYIGSDWKVPTYNVTCTISLPVPGGVTPVPGDTVYAWGHGPANGALAFNDAATTVTYHADYVPAHEAETARVLFPRTWLTSISADDLKAHGSVTFKDQILKSEAEWADGGSYQYGYWLAFSIAIAVVAILFVAAALIALKRCGAWRTPTFRDRCLAEAACPDVDPAVVARLWNGGARTDDEAIVSVMRLVRLGAVRLSWVERDGGRIACLERGRRELAQDKLDRATYDLLFENLAGGDDCLFEGDLAQMSPDRAEAYHRAQAEWRAAVDKAVDRAGVFGTAGAKAQGRFGIAAIAVAVLSVLWWWNTKDWRPVAFLLPAALVVLALSNFMPRRTQAGEDYLARCKALARWLAEGDPAQGPADPAGWETLAEYAYLFGACDRLAAMPAAQAAAAPADDGVAWPDRAEAVRKVLAHD